MESLGYHAEGGEGAVGMPEEGAVKGERPRDKGNAENSCNTERFSGQTILH